MQIPGYKRINIVDYTADQQALVEKLASTLNIGIDNVYLALNNRLTFADNFSATQKTLTVTVDSAGKPTQSLSFPLNTANNQQPRIIGTQIISATNNTYSSVYPTAAPFISYTQSGNTININHIAGLPANNEFALTIVVFH
jgi:hypothetical protein